MLTPYNNDFIKNFIDILEYEIQNNKILLTMIDGRIIFYNTLIFIINKNLTSCEGASRQLLIIYKSFIQLSHKDNNTLLEWNIYIIKNIRGIPSLEDCIDIDLYDSIINNYFNKIIKKYEKCFLTNDSLLDKTLLNIENLEKNIKDIDYIFNIYIEKNESIKQKLSKLHIQTNMIKGQIIENYFNQINKTEEYNDSDQE